MNSKCKPLFKRQLSVTVDNKLFIDAISNQLNLTTLDTWSFKKTSRWLNPLFEKEYIAYRFYVLHEWMKKNEAYSQNYISNLQELLSILDLQDELTELEKQYIDHYKSVVFAKNRNIKNLIVDFYILKDEEVWYRYDLYKIYQLVDGKYQLMYQNPSLYLTNQRLIIDKGNEYLSIFYKDINQWQLTQNMINLTSKCLDFLLISFDIHTIYVSMERIGKLIKQKI